MNRIKPLDGLRAFAVLGVLWAHVWMFYSNVPLFFGGKDVNPILGSGGFGVDLFFVISGFCMYLMYGKKSEMQFTLAQYTQFLTKRWRRIAPAFYAVILFECLFHLYKDGMFPFRSLLFHVTFLNIFDGQNVLSPPFWSLATEWHFYLVLPLIFIRDSHRKWLVLRIAALMFICVVFRIFYFQEQNLSEGKPIATDPIWFRFVEFGWGMLAAIFYLRKRILPKIFSNNIGVALALTIVMLGRMCMVTVFFNRFGDYAGFVRAVGEPIMTFGFAILVLNVIYSKSILQQVLESKPILFMGKISYSMYLWHWIISLYISYMIMEFTGVSNVGLQLSFLISILAIIPVSYLSYKYLEMPYFKKQGSGVSREEEKAAL
jgi:peptidoglycan/LPS O-acetylase OafA/YrhL